MDCPIHEHISESISMVVAVFNPSTLQTNYTQIAVQHSHWDVKVYDRDQQKYIQAPARVICENET